MDVTRQDDRIDPATFLSIMSAFPAGIAVITTLNENAQPVGLTTTALCSVSADPPALLVCVDRGSRTLPSLLSRKEFVVSFLRNSGCATSILFASKKEDKFSAVRWHPSPGGLPILTEDSLAWADCSLLEAVPVGDHVVLIAEVREGDVSPPAHEPLVYFQRSFGTWTPLVDGEEKP